MVELDRTFFVWRGEREWEREKYIWRDKSQCVGKSGIYLGRRRRIYKCRAVKRMLTRCSLPSYLVRVPELLILERSTLTEIPVVVRRDRSKSKDIWRKNKSQVSDFSSCSNLGYFFFSLSLSPSSPLPLEERNNGLLKMDGGRGTRRWSEKGRSRDREHQDGLFHRLKLARPP